MGFSASSMRNQVGPDNLVELGGLVGLLLELRLAGHAYSSPAVWQDADSTAAPLCAEDSRTWAKSSVAAHERSQGPSGKQQRLKQTEVCAEGKGSQEKEACRSRVEIKDKHGAMSKRR
jgi:hypothetical protein